jgi:hypothetical protein
MHTQGHINLEKYACFITFNVSKIFIPKTIYKYQTWVNLTKVGFT